MISEKHSANAKRQMSKNWRDPKFRAKRAKVGRLVLEEIGKRKRCKWKEQLYAFKRNSKKPKPEKPLKIRKPFEKKLRTASANVTLSLQDLDNI